MTEQNGFDPATGAWNDSLTGDFLWSRNNFGEARPDVMSPLTYSITEKVWSEISLLPGYHLSGNICGRYYANVSVSISMLLALGKSKAAAVEQIRDILGNVPQDLEIPTVPLSRWTMLRSMPRMIQLGLKEKRGAQAAPEFLATNPGHRRALRRRIQETETRAGLITLWHGEIMSKLADSMWLMGGAAQPLEASMKFKLELAELVGEADANTLFSNLSAGDDLLASLGPVIGVAQVAQGKLSRNEYLAKYGHRGPHEMELSMPRPAEDPGWLDKQLAEYEENPVDVDALLARRQAEFEAAWQRLEANHPQQAHKLQREIEKIGPAARMREAVK